uniref:Uncharacterized protein n=1 Tax=Anguilla anguilla TaxID=7936 RepID=A0A0E9U4Q4_ANGAN
MSPSSRFALPLLLSWFLTTHNIMMRTSHSAQQCSPFS